MTATTALHSGTSIIHSLPPPFQVVADQRPAGLGWLENHRPYTIPQSPTHNENAQKITQKLITKHSFHSTNSYALSLSPFIADSDSMRTQSAISRISTHFGTKRNVLKHHRHAQSLKNTPIFHHFQRTTNTGNTARRWRTLWKHNRNTFNLQKSKIL